MELLKEVGGNFFEDNFSYTAENIWTSTLSKTFKERWGYDMTEVLPYTLGISAQGHSSLRNYTGTDMETTAPFVIADDTDYSETIGFSDQFDGFSILAAGRDMARATLTSEFGAGFWDGGAY